MNDVERLRQISKRTNVDAFPYRPTLAEVNDLIARACVHRFGIEFLMNGYLGSVAAEFGVHAFTVEAARERVRRTILDQPSNA